MKLSTPSFSFDDDAETLVESPSAEAADVQVGSTPALSPTRKPTFTIVPQRLYDSWSPARQFAYLAARDESSALLEPDFAAWYLDRAAHYRERMRA